MLAKCRYIFKTIFLGSLILTALLIGYFFHTSPVAFIKTAMISPVDVVPAITFEHDAEYINRAVPDARQLIERIPYNNASVIYDILPADRFAKTVLQGNGNCSNLTFGLGFHLLSHNYVFQVVHFLPYDSFLVGAGHTLLNLPYTLDEVSYIGLLDPLEGGIPRVAGTPLDLITLQKKKLPNFSILPLNFRKDEYSEYYGNFLDQSAIGIVPSEEVAKYFRFIDKIYAPLGSKQLERFIFSGFAIVFGRYPHTYVSSEDYSRLFANKSLIIWATQILIWLLRLIPLLAILTLLLHIPFARRSPGAVAKVVTLPITKIH